MEQSLEIKSKKNKGKSLLMGICTMVLFGLGTMCFAGTIFEEIVIQKLKYSIVDYIYFAIFAIVLVALFLCGFSFFGEKDKFKNRLAVCNKMVFSAIGLTLIFDILLTIKYGVDVGGLFTMPMFLVLDVLIILFYIFLLKGKKISTILLIGTLIIYAFGNVLGYQMVTFGTWGELLITIMALYIVIVANIKFFLKPEINPEIIEEK